MGGEDRHKDGENRGDYSHFLTLMETGKISMLGFKKMPCKPLIPST